MAVAPICLALALTGEPSPQLPSDPFAEGPGLEAGEPLPDAPAAVEEARLRGRVTVMGSVDVVSGGTIIVEPGNLEVTVGKDGRFSTRLAPGQYHLIARAPGHQDVEVDVELAADEDADLTLRLRPDPESGVYRTVVREEKPVAVNRTTLRAREIREVPGTQGDPMRVISSLPGAAQLAGFLPYVVVRGAAPGNTGYYLDGARVPILFHVAIGPSVIHPAFIDAVDFYPGGAPVRLGRFVSGMIEGRTRPARRDRVHGDVELRLTDTGALLEIPFNRSRKPGCRWKRGASCRAGDPRTAVTLAGRYSYTAALLSLAQSTARIAFWDYQARLDHRISRRLEYTSFVYGSFDEVGLKSASRMNEETGETETYEPPPFLKFQFHRFDNRLTQRLPGGGQLTYAVVLGVDQTLIASSSPTEVDSTVTTNEWRVAPRINAQVPISPRATLGFGLDQEFQIFRLPEALGENADAQVEDLAYLFSERFVSATAAYVDLAWQKGGVQLRPGVRADFYTQLGRSPYAPSAEAATRAIGVDPRVLAREQVARRIAIKQSVGLYHQPQSTPIPIPGIESFGFERGLQRNLQGAFGYDLALLDGKILVSQEAYLGRLWNLQDYELAAASEDANPVNELEDVITQVTGWVWGLESQARLDPTLRVFGWVAYTLSWSRRDFSASGPAPSSWDQRHIINVVLGYRVRDRWNVGGRLHYNTGRPWTAPVDDQTFQEALIENRNNARLPGFFQLDLRVERIFTFPRWELTAAADVLNATYSREVFQCTPGATGVVSQQQRMFQAMNTPRAAIAKCTPQGFRYVIPQLSLRGRF